MTNDEIVDALRCCVEEDCTRCHVGYKSGFLCRDDVDSKAADAIENLQTENAALRRQIDNLTDAQAVMVKEFNKKLEELCAYKSTGLEPEEIRNALDVNDIIPEINVTVDHIRDLLQAEQAGRLVVLPSKTVWELTMDAGPDCDMKCPVDAFDEALGCDLCSKAKQFAYERPCTQELLKELGKTVFLTREEAEAALAQKGGIHEADSV